MRDFAESGSRATVLIERATSALDHAQRHGEGSVLGAQKVRITTAIHEAATGGNPRTRADPTWTPLMPTSAIPGPGLGAQVVPQPL